MNSHFKILKKLAFASIFSISLNESQKHTHFFFWNKKIAEVEDPKLENGTVYLWGNGSYQARPDWINQFSNFTPKQLTHNSDQNKQISKKVPPFKDVIFTETNIFGIDSKGKVWSAENRKISSFLDKDDQSNFFTINDEKISVDHMLNNLGELQFPEKAKKITSTKRFIWVLSETGNLYSFPLEMTIDKNLAKTNKKESWRQIPSLSNLKDISSGKNHLLMLKSDGSLYSMGNDNMGQCAGGKEVRKTGNPQLKIKITNPEKIKFFEDKKIDKIYSKNNHNFVITDSGEVFGFGCNNMMQLAHEENYASIENPYLCLYQPRRFNHYFDNYDVKVEDIALGDEFSIFLCRNRASKLIQVFGTGMNLHGQLGMGSTKHTNEFQKIELLSDYTITSENGEKPLEINKISCGSNHCIASLAIGSVLIWGSNEFGQIGNKKRSFVMSPMIIGAFKGKNVLGVKADLNSNYIVFE